MTVAPGGAAGHLREHDQRQRHGELAEGEPDLSSGRIAGPHFFLPCFGHSSLKEQIVELTQALERGGTEKQRPEAAGRSDCRPRGVFSGRCECCGFHRPWFQRAETHHHGDESRRQSPSNRARSASAHPGQDGDHGGKASQSVYDRHGSQSGKILSPLKDAALNGCQQ